MIVRKFKAKIVDDFYNKWLNAYVKNAGVEDLDIIKYFTGKELEELAKRISGNVVILTENKYPKGLMNYFEEIDNSFVIYPELFEEINKGNPMNYYAVGMLTKEINVEILGKKENLKLSWADGMIGALPVFTNYEDAVKYCDEDCPIIEITTNENLVNSKQEE